MVIPGPITPLPNGELSSFIRRHTGQDPLRCYQCGKCNAGCPAAYAMDLGPRQVMRAVQLGLKEQVLSSNAIWVCLQCQVCSARCPMEIDIARVMEALRLLAIREEYPEAEKDVALFHRVFLEVVRRHGRAHELELGALYNLRSGHLVANTGILPRMLSHGKLPLLPRTTKGAAEVRRIFTRAAEHSERAAAREDTK
ncbi:MAG: 4Fe-4S dicluster domain-containing protein [Chloroflexi bacterium]|nr:4Fe-4S dicluster domain-containing protein [Chloroflexota bacterium]